MNMVGALELDISATNRKHSLNKITSYCDIVCRGERGNTFHKRLGEHQNINTMLAKQV